MAVYDLILGTTTQKADLNELHLYGASRLGMIEHPVSLWNNGSVTYTPANPATHKAGEMRYEITNYLGNVNAVVNDRKIPRSTLVKATFSVSNESWSATNATLNPGSTMMQVAPSTTGSYANKAFTTTSGKRYILRIRTDKGSSSDLKVSIAGATAITLLNVQQNTILFTAGSTSTNVVVSQVTGSTNAYYIDNFELVEDHIYEATLKMSSDYYPFGMQMPGRHTNDPDYRYGYNGMEKDKEMHGEGNSYTTEFRQYDPRLGRWLSLDPLMADRPSHNPYNFGRNNPIIMVDPSGLQDDWYEDAEGNVEHRDDTEATVIDDNDKVWRNIGKHLDDATIKRIGVGTEFTLFKTAHTDYDHWTTPWAFKNAGVNVPTFKAPEGGKYYHPLMNNDGFAKDRITSNSSMFVANESINSNSFGDAMMGALIGGQGPENFYFGPKSSVSGAMVNSEIVHEAIRVFQDKNKNNSIDELEATPWKHTEFFKSDFVKNLITTTISRLNGGYIPYTSVRQFVGSAAVKIVPIAKVDANTIIVQITIFNVTSVGSGSITQGGGKGDQSFPRPIGENSAQPYTNISQTIDIILAIPLRP